MVEEQNQVIGILSDRDIRQVQAIIESMQLNPEEARHYLKMSDFMETDVKTIGPEEAVSKATRLMIRKKISSLPVVENGKIVGIITETDIMKRFLKMLEE